MTSGIAEKPFFDIDFCQVAKHRENACGDVFMCRRFASDTRTVCVLSDGLGSGVKAHVLANMTATMAMNFCAGDMNIKKAAEMIMGTLPVCSRRHIAYATFTIMDIGQSGRVSIMDYDNPPPLIIRGDGGDSPSVRSIAIRPNGLRERFVRVHELQLNYGDRVVLTSDGVAQSGMGSKELPFGWTAEGVRGLTHKILTRSPEISARDIAGIVTERALENDGGKAGDDITCAVVYMRRGRRLIVVTGPPIDPGRDGLLASKAANFKGRCAICGGTTAKIIARELEREIETDLATVGTDVPPVSSMDGIDLVTEGTITLNRTIQLLEGRTNKKLKGRDAATRLAALLIESDIIEFLVGTRINEAHQDPSMPAELDIRRNLVKRMAQLLDEKYLKTVEINLI